MKKWIITGAAGIGLATVIYLGSLITVEVSVDAPEAQAAAGDQTTTVSAKQDKDGTVTALIEVKEDLPADKILRSTRMSREQILDEIASNVAGLARCQVRFDSCVATYNAQKTQMEAVLGKYDAAVVEVVVIPE